MNFDLDPTTPLAGLHMRGMVTRRFLVSYPVDPVLLTDRLPPGAELSLHDEAAWVSACFVNMKNMRPSVFPRSMGFELNYLIHRTRARLPFPDGKKREAVLVLEPNLDRRVLGWFGARLTGVEFNYRPIRLNETEKSWTLLMKDHEEIVYDAVIPKSSINPDAPASARFSSINSADDFLLGVSFGGQWHAKTNRLRLLAETHDRWNTLMGECKTNSNRFLESLGNEAGSLEADHVISMTDIPHYFAMRGSNVTLPTAEGRVIAT